MGGGVNRAFTNSCFSLEIDPQCLGWNAGMRLKWLKQDCILHIATKPPSVHIATKPPSGAEGAVSLKCCFCIATSNLVHIVFGNRN